MKTWDSPEEISKHLEKSDDPILLVLRAHLMIEERLRAILARICRAPEELPAARLQFHQILCLCRGIIARYDEPVWDFVTRLNEVRNRVAHHLDLGDLDGLLVSVIDKLRQEYGDRLTTPVARFRFAVIYACGYFDAIRGGIRLRAAYASEEEYVAMMEEFNE